ncbi:MAG: flagellar biosynthetic protein FliO [Colwellia sp.]|nr:flagellar biosynthetic protein FliO [Colwellia sp.]
MSRWSAIYLGIFFSTLVSGQEKPSLVVKTEELVPEVGKHVGANMDAMTMIVALIMVILIIIVSAFIMKRFQPKGIDNKGLKIITTMQLGAKERLVVVQVGDKQQLLGVTSGQITLLDTLEQPLDIPSPMSAEIGKSLVSLVQKHVTNKKTLKNETS